MTRLILLGIVAVAVLLIAPFVGLSPQVGGRTIFDAAEEVKGNDADELRERRENRRENGELEERRDDAERFFNDDEED